MAATLTSKILTLLAEQSDQRLTAEEITDGLEHAMHDFGSVATTRTARVALVRRRLRDLARQGRVTGERVPAPGQDLLVWSAPPTAPAPPSKSVTKPAAVTKPAGGARGQGTTTGGGRSRRTPSRATPGARPAPAPEDPSQENGRSAQRLAIWFLAALLLVLGGVGAAGYANTPDEHAPRPTLATPTRAGTPTRTSIPTTTLTTTPAQPPAPSDTDHEDTGEEDYAEEDYVTDTVITIPGAGDLPDCLLTHGHVPDGRQWAEVDCGEGE